MSPWRTVWKPDAGSHNLCYFMIAVPVRHVVLAITGAAVLVLAVYLFFAVRATAAVTATVGASEPASAPAPAPEPSHTTPTTRTAPRAIASAAPTQPPPAEDSGSSYEDQPFDVDEAARTNVKLELIMDQANRSYDHQDYSKAKQIATYVLSKQPGNVRMMRIMVSASCMDSDIGVAQSFYSQLPAPDRAQMKRRCDANGVTLQDPAP
jgi:hypothetical protein